MTDFKYMWVTFRKIIVKGKVVGHTVYVRRGTDGGEVLGHISWKQEWRQHGFFPAVGMAISRAQMQDICLFIERRMKVLF